MSNPTPPDETIDPSQPVPIPNVQVSAHELPGEMQTRGFSDRDNFVNDMATMVDPAAGMLYYDPWWPDTPATPLPPVPIPPSASGRTPVLTLTQIKDHLRIEPSVTVEDQYLMDLEMSARVYTEQYIRQTLDPDRQDDQGQPLGIGENIKQAMRLVIGEWYRNRELSMSGRVAVMPRGFAELLSSVRDYPVY